MLALAHISDLHFGDASARALQALGQQLEAQNPDIVIATGDLTQSGRRKEFEMAADFLSDIKSDILVLPGNHDVPVRNLWARFVAPYSRYERFIGPEINPVFADEKVTAVGLNSARRAALDINWSYGRLSRRQISFAAQQLNAGAKESLKIIAVHHPFVRGPGKAGSRIVGRGEEALTAFAENGLDILFTGHVHVSKAEDLEVGGRGVVVVQAGTAASLRTRGQASSFNMVNAAPDAITVQTYELVGAQFSPKKSFDFVRRGQDGWRMQPDI